MNKRNTIELIIGVLLVICSVFIFNRPITAFKALSYIIGVAAILKGLHLIYLYFKLKDTYTFKANTLIVIGIILCIVGIVFIVKPLFTKNIFAFVLAIWFIYDAVYNFLSLSVLKNINTGLYITVIVSNIVLLVTSICIIIRPWVPEISLAFVMGVTFLISGIENLIFAITGRNDKRTQGLSFRNLN